MGGWIEERWGAFKESVVGSFLIDATLTIVTGGTYLLYKAIPDVPNVPKIITQNRVQAQLEPDWSRPVIYGQTETGGNIVFYNVTGTDNKYLDIVIDICEGEIEGIEKIYMNDEPIPLFDAGVGSVLTSSSTSENKIYASNPLYGQLKASGTYVPYSNFNTLSKYTRYLVNGVNVYPGTDFAVGTDITSFLTNFVSFLNGSSNPSISVATYTQVGDRIFVQYDTAGTAGNSFELKEIIRTASVSVFTAAALKLSGGRDTTYAEGYVYYGTDSQAVNTQLQTAYAGWDTNHTLPGAAYAYIRLIHNPDLFRGGIPQFKFKVRGKKVLDVRTSTTAYSTNPSLCLYDYLTNSRYGKGLSSSNLNTTSFQNAANSCDVLRSGLDVLGSPINYKSYEVGALVDTNNTIKGNVEYFLQSMNANLPYFDGVFYLRVLGAGNATVTINEDDIIGGISLTSPSKKEKLNKILVSFPDSERHYKIGEAPYSNATYLVEDDNEVLSKSITAPYIDYYPRAQDLAELAVNLSRIKSGISFITTQKILENIPGDIVELNYDTMGFTAKECRIASIGIRPDGLCDTVLVEHFDSFYTLTQKQELPTPNDTTLKSPYDVSKPIILELYSNADTHLLNADGTVIPRIYVSWESNDEYAFEHSIFYKKSTDSNFTKAGSVYQGDALAFYISNLAWGIDYDIGIQTANSLGIKSILAVGTVTLPNPLASGAYTFPNVTGLELIGKGTDQGQGNDTEFSGKDIRLQWRLSSNNVKIEFGSDDAERLGGSSGVVPFNLKGYKVKVYHPGDTSPRQVYTVTDTNFTYTLDKNIEDGNGDPSRTVTFEVIAFGNVQGYGLNGESAKAAKLIATNPAPALPSSLNISPNFQVIEINYIKPSDPDYKAMKVWLGTSSGFARNNATLKYDGPDTRIIFSGLTSGGTYYLRFSPYDDFGTDASVESSEYTVTLPQAISGDEVTSITADKITSGTLTEQVNVAGVFVATGTETVMNKTFTGSEWRAELGPVTVGPTTYILRYHNGTTTNFSIDSAGNAIFAGNITVTGGSGIGSFSDAGALATASSADWSTQVTGAGKPSDNADVTSSAITSGVTLSSGALTFTQASINRLQIDGANKRIWINDSTYGNDGIQIEYNSGNPRAHIGNKNGSGPYLEFDGTDLITKTLKTSTGSGKRVELNPSGDNEIHFYGDRGDTTIEELATIGISTIGSDNVIGKFGSTTSSNIAVYARSTDNHAVFGSISGSIGGGDAGVVGAYAGPPTEEGYGVIAETITATGASNKGGPLWINCSSATSSAPTHSAMRGTVWVTSLGAFYINTTTGTSPGTTWTKIIATSDGLIHQGNISTGLQSSSGAVASGTTADLSYTGGTYTFLAGLSDDVATFTAFSMNSMYSGTGHQTGCGLSVFGASTRTYYFQTRYVNASAPYKLNEIIETPFIFLIVNSNGDIVSADVSDAPPWVYNGPTKTTADYIDGNGKQFIRQLIVPESIKALKLNGKYREYAGALNELKQDPQYEMIELTPDMKNADMDIVQSPWPTLSRRAEGNIVLLDSNTPLMREFHHLHKDGENVAKIIMDGYLSIDNTPLERVGPKDIITVSARWK